MYTSRILFTQIEGISYLYKGGVIIVEKFSVK
jgi:hypothetical protein